MLAARWSAGSVVRPTARIDPGLVEIAAFATARTEILPRGRLAKRGVDEVMHGGAFQRRSPASSHLAVVIAEQRDVREFHFREHGRDLVVGGAGTGMESGMDGSRSRCDADRSVDGGLAHPRAEPVPLALARAPLRRWTEQEFRESPLMEVGQEPVQGCVDERLHGLRV